MPIFQPNTPMICPHCSKTLEDVVDDYAIPGRVGKASQSVTDCGWCDQFFSVEKRADGTFLVDKSSQSLRSYSPEE